MRGRRTDGNQKEIVALLRAGGCTVVITSAVGSLGGNLAGFPDLVVKGPDKRIYFVEIKMPGGKLTDREKAFAYAWDLNGDGYIVMRDDQDALEFLNKCRGVVQS